MSQIFYGRVKSTCSFLLTTFFDELGLEKDKQNRKYIASFYF